MSPGYLKPRKPRNPDTGVCSNSYCRKKAKYKLAIKVL